MSTFRVTAERLTIHEHTNADALELAQVGLYRAVVAKGAFRTGEYALYIPEQAVLPEALIDELGLTGKLAGSAHNRVKAVRLRAELSQGVVCLPRALAEQGVDLEKAAAAGTDFAELLGITKWIPPVPVAMSGEVESAPDLIRWTEIENIKRYPDIFEPGEPVVATEKLHGTACLYTYVVADDRSYLSSKGFGARNLALQEAAGNLYWRAANHYAMAEIAKAVAAEYGVARVALFGEVYGAGVQDLHYGANAGLEDQIGYALFDLALDLGVSAGAGAGGSVDAGAGGEVRFLPAAELDALAERLFPHLPRVPELYRGPYDEAALLALATGRETVSGQGVHLREGLVVRSATERHSPLLGGRAIAKFVSDDYLIRKGGTEFE